MHKLVQLHYLTHKEFERNLQKLSDEDACRHIEPMNCISWIIAHVACQYQAYFVDWPQGRETDLRYLPFGYGAPRSEPVLEDALVLWHEACQGADTFMQSATNESLQEICTNSLAGGESWGTLLVRSIFHTWCHLGEISSIRQVLGHKPPEFVDMHRWAYDGS